MEVGPRMLWSHLSTGPAVISARNLRLAGFTDFERWLPLTEHFLHGSSTHLFIFFNPHPSVIVGGREGSPGKQGRGERSRTARSACTRSHPSHVTLGWA